MDATNTTKTTAPKAKAPRDWQCQECGKRMTAKAAERAMYGGTDGCPKCGGMDIDLAVLP
jgi:uncharacterized protein YlaI